MSSPKINIYRPHAASLEGLVFAPLAAGGGVWTGIVYSTQDGDFLDITYYVDAEGNFHRDDGPSCLINDATVWHQHGVLHRVDGPAFERATNAQWWLDGVRQADMA